MTSITSKAIVSQVKIGSVEVEGLMLPNGDFAIAVSQMSALNLVPPNRSQKQLKALLGIDLPSHQAVKSELNSKAVNIISLADFEKVIIELAIKGNQKAADFARMMIGLSLHQLFCDSFGIKFEQEHRQEWLKQRMIHKKQFHPYLTAWLQTDGCENYGQAVNLFKACANLPIKPVEQYDDEELRLLNNAEVSYNVLRKTGMRHEEAMKYI